MNSAMNQECSFVEYFDFSMVEDVSVMVDSKQIALVDAIEVDLY